MPSKLLEHILANFRRKSANNNRVYDKCLTTDTRYMHKRTLPDRHDAVRWAIYNLFQEKKCGLLPCLSRKPLVSRGFGAHQPMKYLKPTMDSPLILTAFGNDPAARLTYQRIETAIRDHYPGREILWSYNARTMAREHRKGNSTVIRQPAELLQQLAADGWTSVTLQTLQLFPGQEFHELYREVRQLTGISCRMGRPLFSSPRDYQTLLDLLAPLILRAEQQAVLLVGHGTRHPVWPVYLALEHLLQRRFGPLVFVGVVEHYPATADMEERILACGCRNVLMIPLFFVAGLHFRRDMMEDNGHSWRSRLLARGLAVEVVQEGIGLLPGIDRLVIRHIEEAEAACGRNG